MCFLVTEPASWVGGERQRPLHLWCVLRSSWHWVSWLFHEQNLLQVDGVPSVEGSDAAFCQENSGPPLSSEEEDSGRRRAQEEKERLLMGGWHQPRPVWGVGLLRLWLQLISFSWDRCRAIATRLESQLARLACLQQRSKGEVVVCGYPQQGSWLQVVGLGRLTQAWSHWLLGFKSQLHTSMTSQVAQG